MVQTKSLTLSASFLDEAHKLPALIKGDDDAMKCILDALLVLTKQGAAPGF